MKGRNVTIKDVAREAGVSVATVSRALNQNYPVSEKLQKRISDAVEKLDYHPNAIARTLKTNSTHTIGFLVSDISNDFFTTILKGVEDVIEPHCYNVISCSTDGRPEKELSYLRLLLDKRIDGLIINTTGKNDEYIAQISKRIPVVLSSRKISDPEFVGDFVGSDDFSGIHDLTRHLLDLGHTRIGLINGSLEVSTGQDRYEGFCSAMRSRDIAVDASYPFVCNIGFHAHSGYEGAKTLMEQETPPTAIVIANNQLTMGAMKYLNNHGFRLPDDVSIVCFGDVANWDILYVRPTIASFNLTTIGNKLGNMLMERIKNSNQFNNREIRYMSSIVEGNSTREFKSDGAQEE